MNGEAADFKTIFPKDGKKLGMALSGGGFRAAFFHIGVLARMARLGLLQSVEVISTVSGGSIIGALYYLHVKRLLEDKSDGAVTPKDYQTIVSHIEIDFFRAVEHNLRMLTFADVRKNLRMSRPDYSRSDRIGELYDEYFYRPILRPGSDKPVEMRELKIFPRLPEGGNDTSFNPEEGNAARQAKVPILLINAALLNTGHNWRFEAVTMGASRRTTELELDVDKNLRLLRPCSYAEIILKQQNIELGLAVAASACVPGLFYPLAISDLYPQDIRLELVDGGVHDNQGIQGLVEKGCDWIVMSDACGQMSDELNPSTATASVLKRTSDIVMDRVREEQIFRIKKDKNLGAAFIHLRKGLKVEAVPWNGPDGQPYPIPPGFHGSPASAESFGVADEVQERLSKVRTDLDSFTEIEAYSLMLDGYLMSEGELRGLARAMELPELSEDLGPEKWKFLKIKPWISDPTSQYQRHLEVASHIVFKYFRLSWLLTGTTVLVLGLLLLSFLDLSLIEKMLSASFTVQEILVGVSFLVAALFFPWASGSFKLLQSLSSYAKRIVPFFMDAIFPAMASVLVQIHLKTFDRLFLWLGRIERLSAPRKAPGQDRMEQVANRHDLTIATKHEKIHDANL